MCVACGVAFSLCGAWPALSRGAATTGAARGAGGARAQAGPMTPGASAGRFRLVRAPGEQMPSICGARGRAAPQECRAALPRPLVPGAGRSAASPKEIQFP